MLVNPSTDEIISGKTKKDTPFITMNEYNLSKYDIQPVEDYVFIFDIDDTLYKASEEMLNVETEKWKKVYDFYLSNMKEDNKIVIPPFSEIMKCNPLLSESFFKYFGKYPIEVDLYKEIVDFGKYVKKDDKLINLLKNFPYRKFCFTNGLRCRAEPILKTMEITDLFDCIICMDDKPVNNSVMGKPKKEAYDFVEKLLNIKDRSKVFFFDDAIINIEEGTRRGWNSYLVKSDDNIVDMVNKILTEISADMDR